MNIKRFLVAAVVYTAAVHLALIIYGYLIMYFGEKVGQLRFILIGILGFCGIYSLSIYHRVKKAPMSKYEGVVWVLSCSVMLSLLTYGVSLYLDSSTYLAFSMLGGLMSLPVLSVIFFFIAPKLFSSLR